VEEENLLPRLELIVEEAFDSGVAALIDDLDVGVMDSGLTVNSSLDAGALTGVVVVAVVNVALSELLTILAEEGVVTFDDEDKLPTVDG
jgi:hypothetical protein